jgi:hypothetical protein
LPKKMFNRTTSTKFFTPSLCQRTDQPLAEPRPQRMKSEFRISKPETNYDSNPKSQFRNSKQHQNSNYRNHKLFNSRDLEIRKFVIRICFVFRISCFEFFVLRSWRALRLCESDLFPDSLNPSLPTHGKVGHEFIGRCAPPARIVRRHRTDR